MKSAKDILHKLNYVITARQKRQYILVAFVAFIGSLWELLGVAAILPFIETIMTPEAAEQKWYTRMVLRFFHAEEPLQRVTVLGLFIIFIYVVKNLYLMFSTYVQSRYSTAVQRDLSIRMTDTYLKSSYLFHLENNSAALIRSINQDVVGVFGMFFYIFRILSELFTVAAISIYIVTLDPMLALSLVGILGSCMVLLFFGMKRLIKYFGKKQQECESRMLQYLSQAFNGIKEIMVKNRQGYFTDAFRDAANDNAKATRVNYFVNSVTTYIYEVVCIGGLMGIVIVRLHMTADVTDFVAKLATVAVAAFRLFPAVGRLTNNLNGIVYNSSRLDYLYDMLKTIEESRDYLLKDAAADEGSLEFRERLDIKDVRWRYPTGQEDVLERVSLTVHKGESVALIGPSGAGKTTLADVILGLLHPQKGQITLDGEDVYEHPAGWAAIIGYVPQAVYLMDDNIRANVAFGMPPETVDDEKVWAALREAQLETYVKKQPDGLDTMVGERGVRLSGGQRQRIAIARALYDEPEILVLDEATSALDNETESAVMEAIETLHGSKTLIIVAHRLSTIRNCDSIYEVRDGAAHKRKKSEVLGGEA